MLARTSPAGGDIRIHIRRHRDRDLAVATLDQGEGLALLQRDHIAQTHHAAIGRADGHVEQAGYVADTIRLAHADRDLLVAGSETHGDDTLIGRTHLTGQLLRINTQRHAARRASQDQLVLAEGYVVLDARDRWKHREALLEILSRRLQRQEIAPREPHIDIRPRRPGPARTDGDLVETGQARHAGAQPADHLGRAHVAFLTGRQLDLDHGEIGAAILPRLAELGIVEDDDVLAILLRDTAIGLRDCPFDGAQMSDHRFLGHTGCEADFRRHEIRPRGSGRK